MPYDRRVPSHRSEDSGGNGRAAAGQRAWRACCRNIRARGIKGWIESGAVKVDRGACKPRDLVAAGSRVRVQMTVDEAAQPQILPEAIALRVVHEDRDVLVIDKPAGLVVHPGAGNPQAYPAECPVGAGSARWRRCRAPA